MRRKALYIMTVATLAILSVACKISVGLLSEPNDFLQATDKIAKVATVIIYKALRLICNLLNNRNVFL